MMIRLESPKFRLSSQIKLPRATTITKAGPLLRFELTGELSDKEILHMAQDAGQYVDWEGPGENIYDDVD